MRYIIALGNPGAQYERTRHNVAWRVADAIVADGPLTEPRDSSRYAGAVSGGAWRGIPVAVLYPTTFMNQSGRAAAALVPTDKRAEMVVIHDEIALPLGKIRISVGSSAAGHNGVRSVIEAAGTTSFIRVRLGVGAPPVGIPLDRYVLLPFLPEEEPLVKSMVVEAMRAVLCVITEGVEVAMNTFNTGDSKNRLTRNSE